VATLEPTPAPKSEPVTPRVGKKYTIYLSNNFIGNDWRQQMERVAQVVARKPPLGGRIELKVENADNTVQAQLNSLKNIIRAKPDAILVNAGSSDALNQTLKKACDAGILVISFDQVVTEPRLCARIRLEQDPCRACRMGGKADQRQG
jgi:ribose transport system substrate-binding protein